MLTVVFLLKELCLPDFRNYRVEVKNHGDIKEQDTKDFRLFFRRDY